MRQLHILSVLTFLAAPAAAQCDHEIEGFDSFGDGWNGASVDVNVNGMPALVAFTVIVDNDFAAFTANTGDTIDTIYTNGTFDNEVTYDVYGGDGTSPPVACSLLGSDGPFPVGLNGLLGNCTGGALPCPSLPPQPILNPMNGNYYLAVAGGIRWDDARAAAEATSFMGMPGRLVSINDAAENDFVYNNLGANVDRFWLGAFQDPTDPGFVEPGGGFVWTSGEPFAFTMWNPGEPNNFVGAGDENYVAFDNNPNWNDAPIDWAFNAGYIIEYGGGVGADLCNGDGGDQTGCTNCPCGNNAAPGSLGGCINSAAVGARLFRSGSGSASAADLRMEMSGGVPGSFAVLTSGDAVAPQNMANPCFGTNSGVQAAVLDGLRCAVQSTQRHGGRPVATDGTVGMGLTNGWGPPNGPNGGLAGQGGFVAGDTRYFQVFYRELPGMVCLTEQNTTQAVEVSFTP